MLQENTDKVNFIIKSYATFKTICKYLGFITLVSLFSFDVRMVLPLANICSVAQKLSAQLCDYIIRALRGYNETQLSSELGPPTLHERPCDAIFTLTSVSAYSAFRAQPRINLWLIGQMRDELSDRLFTPTSVPLPPHPHPRSLVSVLFFFLRYFFFADFMFQGFFTIFW